MEPSARFDDAATGESFALAGCRDELVATGAAHVRAVIAAAERAADDGAWVAGWVSYEAAAGLDPSLPVLDRAADDGLGGVPLAWFGVFDRRVPAARAPAHRARWVLDATPEAHRGAVADIKRRIAAGLAYQVNLTARAHACVADPSALYQGLVDAQGGAFGAFLETSTHTVGCASPELFFELDGDRIVTRPMKGTARRGRWSAEDEDLGAALQASPKERAENVMIVDLMRNDIGRIARYGSVVPKLFDTERYPTMWQMTSTVEGRLRAGLGLDDVFAALFPAGSVTGAPKRAAMQAITEVEPRPRGVYCGAVGYCAPGPEGKSRFAVAIRTATTNRVSGYTEYGSGGGITWSSDPDAEWRELVGKTSILDPRTRVDGLFETFRSDGANVGAHLDRLAASARYFGIPFERTSVGPFRPARRVRLELRADGSVTAACTPLPQKTDQPVRLVWCDHPVNGEDVRMYHKTVHRDMYPRPGEGNPGEGSAEEARADDVILVNERGEVTETTIANIAVELDGRWWTPPIACGLLPGVERGRLVGSGALAERVITPDDVDQATALAVVSSLRGWRPAVVIRERTQPALRPARRAPVGPPSGW